MGDKILFLDASSPTVQVGILNENEWIGYYRSEEQVLQSLFQGVEVCLKMSGIEFKDIDHFAYCEGPGSLLGIRVTSMAIMGWKALEVFKEKKIYAYNSFDVSTVLVKKLRSQSDSFYIVSGVRTGLWNILSSKEKIIYEIKEEELKNLKGEKWYFKQRKMIGKDSNLDLKEFDYNLENCASDFLEKGWLREVQEADALVVKEPEYVKWDFKRHAKE